MMTAQGIHDKIMTRLATYGFSVNDSHWLDEFCWAVAHAVHEEITTNAKATGTDSRGDSHTLSIV